MHNHMSHVQDNLHSHINNVHDRINKLHEIHAAHQIGHLPKLTPTQLNKALKMCGADGDHVVMPQTSNAKQNYIEAYYVKPLKV